MKDECNISLDLVSNYEGCKLISRQHRMAVKTHKCEECGEDILPGENYEKIVGKIDGQLFTVKTCSSCLSMRNTFFDSYYYHMIWDDLENEIEETYGNVSEACMVKLDKKAREKVCEIIERYWEKHYDEEEE
jgi:hypothetical protein